MDLFGFLSRKIVIALSLQAPLGKTIHADGKRSSIKAKPKEAAHLLEEVLLAVDASCPGETFVRQRCLAVGALEALGVPVSVQHLQDELVQDVLTTACTLRDLCDGNKSSDTQLTEKQREAKRNKRFTRTKGSFSFTITKKKKKGKLHSWL